ncbi:MAG: LysR family transcriptional regulator [Eubacteriales bacterium]|nr:LysR family transcriptional regulator [Eubacteriales bacterium]
MFENMDYIYEVFKAGSFSKAAKNLYISQPSLSATVKRVEEKEGYAIFDRSVKPLKLTEFGEKYIESVLSIKAIEKSFESFKADYGELKTGSLKLGGTNLVSSIVLPKMIEGFKHKFPNVSTELFEGTSPDLEAMLSDGTVDMVIDYSFPNHESFESRTIEDEYLVLAVPKSYEINKGLEKYLLDTKTIKDGGISTSTVETVPLEKFRDLSFVLLKKKNDTYQRAVKICAEAGFTPKASFVGAQQMTAYHVCASGMGAAFVSSILIKHFPDNPDLCYYRLDPKYSRRPLCLIWKKERYMTKAMREFENLII